MQTLLGILEDFHYDLLSGTVSYDEDGTLELQMSLRGQNPSVEGGRPVHLNVVLQENLPGIDYEYAIDEPSESNHRGTSAKTTVTTK